MTETKLKFDFKANTEASLEASRKIIFALGELEKVIEAQENEAIKNLLHGIFKKILEATGTIVSSGAATATGLAAIAGRDGN